jgi:hypothetical protein
MQFNRAIAAQARADGGAGVVPDLPLLNALTSPGQCAAPGAS